MEPLLGLVDLRKILTRNGDTLDALLGEVCSKESGCVCEEIPGLGWIITGGESGPKARPSHPAWFRSLRDQCVKTDTPFHFKQWGEWMHDSQQVAQSKDTLGLLVLLNGEPGERHDWDDGTSSYRIGKKNAGRVLDGRTWDELPKVGA
jgi:protein gp37